MEPTVTRQTAQPTTGSATIKKPRKYKYGSKRYSLEQMLRDPKKRAQLPTDALSPAQQIARRVRLRREKENADPMYNPSAALQGSTLAETTRKLAGLELDPQLGAINREMDTATRQGQALEQRAGDYYRQTADRNLQTSAAIDAIGQRLAGRLQEIGTGASGAIGQIQAGEQQRAQQDAQLRGEGLDGGRGAMVSAEVAAQRANAERQQQIAQTTAAQQNAAAAMLSAQTAQSTEQAGGEETGRIRNRLGTALAELRGKRTDLEGQRGALETKYLTDLRQKEFENSLLRKEFNLKEATTAAEIAAGATKAASEADSKREDFIAKYGVSPEKWRSMSPDERLSWKAKWDKAGKTPPKGKTTDHYGYDEAEWRRMSPEARRKAKARWDNAGKDPKDPKSDTASVQKTKSRIMTASDYFRVLFDDHPAWDRNRMISHAQRAYPDKYGRMSTVELHAAIDLAVHGKVRKPSRKRLKSIGVRTDDDGQLV